MAIPAVSRSHVFSALHWIDHDGVPAHRESTRYHVVHGDRRYPPKYVLSLAVEQATGRALDPQEFSGGTETNTVLRRLGFHIKAADAQTADATASSGSRSAPLIGRVITRTTRVAPAAAGTRLCSVLEKEWPEKTRVKFLITPGGFVSWPFPSGWRGGVGWASRPRDLEPLIDCATEALSRTLTSSVLAAAERKVRVLTIGIDLIAHDSDQHAELIAAYDVPSRRAFWTGKSYPTAGQERSLVQVTHLETHLLRVAGERVLVLGCHDLNMFSPRGWANQRSGGPRHARCAAMRRLARDFKPTVVLQHPHLTDSPNIWRTAWAGLRKQLPTVEAWASGIAYRCSEGKPRGRLADVLEATHGGSPCLDLC